MHRNRPRLALAAAGALCAALAGCAAQTTPVGSITTSANAPSGPGQWSEAQKSEGQLELEGEPIADDTVQAACVVKIAAQSISWQQFEDYLKLVRAESVTGPPSDIGGFLNVSAKLCGTHGVPPGLGNSGSS